jgi:ABC-type antimicrobial peptide transport system permease subunit
MRLALRLTWQDLLHDRSRTLLSVIGLAVVILSYFLLSALAGAFSSYINSPSLSRNLIVVQKDLIDPSDARLEPQVIQAAQELIPTIISRLSPLVYRHTRVGAHVVQLRAAAVADWEPVYHLALLAGAWPAGMDEIVVGEGLARTNAWTVGAVVPIFGRDFRIVGIFRSPGAAFASVWMPIDAFWALFDARRGYQALFVQAAVGVDPQTALTRLQADPRLAGSYAVYFEDNFTRRNIQALQDLHSILRVASLLALLGIVFGVFNATALSLVERSRELGILLSLGFTPRQVRYFMLARTLLQGLLAYTIGLAAAWLYGAARQAYAPFFVLGLPLALRITPALAAAGLAWVLGLAGLGAWLSLRRMSRLPVVDLLRPA